MNHKQKELMSSLIIAMIIFIGFSIIIYQTGIQVVFYSFLNLLVISFLMGLSFNYFYKRKKVLDQSQIIVIVGTPMGFFLRPIFSWFWLIVKSMVLFPIIGLYRIGVLIFGK